MLLFFHKIQTITLFISFYIKHNQYKLLECFYKYIFINSNLIKFIRASGTGRQLATHY